MAQNRILTISMITRESLDVLSNMLNITKHSTRKFDDEFGVSGRKIGTVLNVRKPAVFECTEGPVVDIQAQNETYVPLALNKQYQVSSAFTANEFSMSMDDFRERFILPAMNAMANKIESDGAALMRAAAYNAVGTPGVALSGGNDAFQSALTLLQENLVMDDGRLKMTVSPKTNQYAVKNGQNYFNPAPIISDQYMKGVMGADAYGFTWYTNQLTGSHTVGTYSGSPVIAGVGQTGSSININGFTSGATLNVGDVVQLPGVYAVNFATKDVYDYLQDFVVTAPFVATGTGDDLQVSPALVTSGALQNVSASPTDGAAVVMTKTGASGAKSNLSFAWHPEAIAFATGHLEVAKAVEFGAYETDPATGLSLRIMRAWDVRTDQFITRLDLLGGWATLYDQFLVRINN